MCPPEPYRYDLASGVRYIFFGGITAWYLILLNRSGEQFDGLLKFAPGSHVPPPSDSSPYESCVERYKINRSTLRVCSGRLNEKFDYDQAELGQTVFREYQRDICVCLFLIKIMKPLSFGYFEVFVKTRPAFTRTLVSSRQDYSVENPISDMTYRVLRSEIEFGTNIRVNRLRSIFVDYPESKTFRAPRVVVYRFFSDTYHRPSEKFHFFNANTSRAV